MSITGSTAKTTDLVVPLRIDEDGVMRGVHHLCTPLRRGADQLAQHFRECPCLRRVLEQLRLLDSQTQRPHAVSRPPAVCQIRQRSDDQGPLKPVPLPVHRSSSSAVANTHPECSASESWRLHGGGYNNLASSGELANLRGERSRHLIQHRAVDPCMYVLPRQMGVLLDLAELLVRLRTIYTTDEQCAQERRDANRTLDSSAQARPLWGFIGCTVPSCPSPRSEAATLDASLAGRQECSRWLFGVQRVGEPRQ